MRGLLIPVILGVLLLTVAIITRTGILARDDPGTPINSAMREALAARSPQWTTRQSQLLAERYAGARETPSGLRYSIRAPGTGDSLPQERDVATIHYTISLLDDAQTPIESTVGKEPFNYLIGAGGIIPAWDEAVRAMRRGERRTYVVPWWRAYGEKGYRDRIPDRAALVIDFELVDFRSPAAAPER